jgi:hypothetical protein
MSTVRVVAAAGVPWPGVPRAERCVARDMVIVLVDDGQRWLKVGVTGRSARHEYTRTGARKVAISTMTQMRPARML